MSYEDKDALLYLADVRIDQLDAENAKLRELVRDMCEWAYVDSSCDLEDRFADRMRELGIEVDE